MRNLIFIFLIFSGIGVSSQPPINQWYSVGCPQTEMLSVVPTDSCYYASLIAINNPTDLIWDQHFLKINFDGNVVADKILHFDTSDVFSYGSNMIASFDGELVTVCSFKNNYIFCRYSPDQDTIYTSFLDSMYLHHGFTTGQPGRVIQRNTDSTFYFIGQLQDTTTMKVHLSIFHLNKIGELLSFNSSPVENGYYSWGAADIIDVGDGLVYSSYIIKSGATNEGDRLYVRLTKTDYNLNESWMWTDWDNLLDYLPYGLIKTNDDGFLYGGVSGKYNTSTNGIRYKAQIKKINSDFSPDWEIEMFDSTGAYWINCSDIIEKGNNRYIAVGHHWTDSMTQGWMIEFDIEGKIIWDSYFSFIGSTPPNNPMHFILDVAQTPDNGYILAGTAHDVATTNQGVFGRFGWLVKTDSVGCLVPGCQDFFDLEELQTTIQLNTYPNPTRNWLNIYYYDNNFSGKAEAQVYDLSGRLVHSWQLHSNDMTYIYNVSKLDAGPYILKVVEYGESISTQRFVKI